MLKGGRGIHEILSVTELLTTVSKMYTRSQSNSIAEDISLACGQNLMDLGWIPRIQYGPQSLPQILNTEAGITPEHYWVRP